MCGILACRTNGSAVDFLSVGMRRLEYRGYDSVGIAVQTASGEVARLRTVGRMAELDKLIKSWPGAPFNGIGIGHTRWATHGAVTAANAHPHTDCTGRINLVHNGIVANVVELRRQLVHHGHHFVTTVDSEVLSHLIEHELEQAGDLFAAVQIALRRVHGSWAIAVLEEGTGRIVLSANDSPLLVARSEHGEFAASDIAAVADWTDEFRVLDDEDVVELADGGRWVRRTSGPPVIMARPRWRGRDQDLGDYSDFMAKEIDEQPAAATRVLDRFGDSVASGALWIDTGVAPFERLRVIGCGSSLNAGQVIGNLVRRLGAIPVTVTVASEAAEGTADAGQLCLAISQSGETADVLQAVRSTAVAEEPLVALTNNTHSTLTRCADAVLTCEAGPEIGVAATKTFICQIIAGAALMISALVATGRIHSRTAARLTDDLRRLPEQLAAAIRIAKCDVPPLAEQFQDSPGVIFVARGSGLPYAGEGALKFTELTYRWAQHYPAGELKHGPLALVGQGTPVVVVGNGNPKLVSNIAEIAARGGRVVTIGSAGATISVVDDLDSPWGPLSATVPMQILARAVALALGNDVDKPRNLAKSVTVE